MKTVQKQVWFYRQELLSFWPSLVVLHFQIQNRQNCYIHKLFLIPLFDKVLWGLLQA
ncbi:MAG: hypothetical protein WBD50_04000 [Candidatus Rhabdochlamydia sp.]